MTSFKKYLTFSLIFAAINAVLLLVFFVPRFDHTDTGQYIATIDYFSEKPGGEIYLHRILKPLPIFISVLLSPIFDAKSALIFQNLIFYFLSIWLIFILIYRIYQSEKQAFCGAVLYAGAYPMLAYGLAPLTDSSGWFFYILSIFLSLNFLKNPSFKTAVLPGLVAGLGMLFKENLAAAPFFFAALLFFAATFNFKEKLKYLFCFGITFLAPVLINSLIIYKIYHYSYFQWYWDVSHHGESSGFYAYSFLRTAIEVGRVFALGWIFFVLGILKEIKSKNKERQKILISLVPPSLSFFLWSFPHNRIVFIAAPLLAFLGSFGVLRNFKNSKIAILTEVFSLFFYLAINYFFLEFFLRYGPSLQNKF